MNNTPDSSRGGVKIDIQISPLILPKKGIVGHRRVLHHEKVRMVNMFAFSCLNEIVGERE